MTHNTDVENYKKGLSDICKMSGLGMCPGCGLTPEGLEKLTALAVEKERERIRSLFSHTEYIKRNTLIDALSPHSDTLEHNEKNGI